MATPTLLRLTLAALLAVSALGGCSEDRAADDDDATTTTVSDSIDACADDLFACAQETMLADVLPDEPTEAEGEPIVIGMINQENTPVASFPELSAAVQAAVDFVNAELGGVGGRPLQLDVCNTEFSPEGSTACAQGFVEAGAPAVVGGIDVWGTAIDTLEENGVPYVGGIPASTPAVTSPLSYQFSGGVYGPTIAFAHHAAEAGATTVALAYPEYDPATEAAAAGEAVLEREGVEQVQLIPYPVTATDLTSPLQAAAAIDPDALIMLAADTGCEGTFDGIETVGITAQLYLVGACATPSILEEAGPAKTEGTIFNVEGELEGGDPDRDLYFAVSDAYGEGFDPIGAGTVSFRSFMNLYVVMAGLGGDLTSEAVAAALDAQVDAPSFMGHPYTCDKEQLPGQPAMCSPQQILAQRTDGELVQITDWIDVGASAAG